MSNIRTQSDEMAHVVADPDKFRSREYLEYADNAAKIGVVPLGHSMAFHGSRHDPELMIEQLANGFMVQMFDASDLAPGQMKDKVLAYQEEIMVIQKHYLRQAMRSERIRIGLVLEAAGHSNAASLVKKLPL